MNAAPSLESAGAHTVGRWVVDRAAQSPHAIAIDDRGVTIDYATLAGRASALAATLRAHGYRPGCRIATISGNSADHVVAFFACAMAGVAFVPLSWRLTPGELGGLVERSDPDLLLVDDEHVALAGEALRTASVSPPTALLGAAGVEQRVPAAARAGEERTVRDDDPLLVIFTSGSEAAPKGVVLTHANCFWNNMALAGALPLTSGDVVLAMLPQFHVAAWNCQPLLAWWVGATVVLERAFDPARALQLLTQRRVTAMMGVPTQYAMLATDPRWPSADLRALRLALVGGATVPSDVRRAWAERGVPLTQGYGLTEAGPNVLRLADADARVHPDAVGSPYPHVEVQLVDPDTQLTLEGVATGELWVRGPSVFAGYLFDDAATERARAGAWVRSGDLAHRDADGIFTIVDRLKDIYISGGENVAPAEVERELVRHELIAAAAVVGAPDPVWGERGVAFVVREPGAALSTDEVLAHARTHLAGFKVPVAVEFLDALPTSAIGKIARARLRSRAARLVEGASREHAR